MENAKVAVNEGSMNVRFQIGLQTHKNRKTGTEEYSAVCEIYHVDIPEDGVVGSWRSVWNGTGRRFLDEGDAMQDARNHQLVIERRAMNLLWASLQPKKR